MAKLTDEEKGLLKRLQDKANAPDEAPIGKSLNITLDLSNESAVAIARKMGLLPSDDDGDGGGDGDGGDGGGDGDGGGGDDTPKRKGYFGN